MAVIYSLSCPFSGHVKYIGRTTWPEKRLMQHVYAAKSGRCANKDLEYWILTLLSKGSLPIFDILIHCEQKELHHYEYEYVNKYYPKGHLLNIQLTTIRHGEIDYNGLRQIVKQKKIRYAVIAQNLNVSYCSVAGYLTGQTCQLSLEKARLLKDYILSH